MELECNEASVLADELEERGDPRAGLVRAQLQGREHDELLRAHWRQWLGEFHGMALNNLTSAPVVCGYLAMGMASAFERASSWK